jgi:hypothetical protein
MHIIRTATRVVPLLIVLASLMPGRVASAQSLGRFEVGGQVSALRIQDFGSTPAGFGGRFSFDLSDWLSVESELNFFPRDTITVDGQAGADLRVAYRRQRSEAVFGPKLGMRTERFGVFAKVRPGFVRLSDQGVDCVGDVCALATMLLARPVYRTEFALDLGAVLEFYPSARTVARVDVGDTLIRHRSQVAPPCPNCTSHNFASRVGIGLRF